MGKRLMMKKYVLSFVLGTVLLLMLIAWARSAGEPGPRLVLMPFEYVVSNENMQVLRAAVVGPDEMLVEVPEPDMVSIEAAGIVLGFAEGAPLWNSPHWVPDEVLDAAGVELVFRTEWVTIFSGGINEAYQLVDSGYSISRLRMVPVHTLTAPSPGVRLLAELEASRPLTPERIEFMRAVTGEASADSVEKGIYFFNFDETAGESGEYRSRFCARYDLKDDVTPYIRQRLEKYVSPAGGTVWEQEFTPELPDGYKTQDTVFVNVIADMPGTKTSARYIVCAHYDAIASRTPGWEWETDPAPGADDNASGAITVLECARLLAGLEFDFGVTFALWSAEEIGLLGSEFYADGLAEEDTVIGVINIDMIGYVGEIRMNELSYGWRSEWLSSALQETADSLDLETVFQSYFRPAFHNSDHASFWVQRIPALMLGDQTLGYVPDPLTPYYHTVRDTLGTVDLNQVTDNIRLVAGYLSRFADLPPDSLSDLEITPASIEFEWTGRSSFHPMVAGQDLTVNVRGLNKGGSMSDGVVYTFEVWRGSSGTGTLVYEAPVALKVVSGGTAEASATFKTSTAVYGQVDYAVSLLPVDDDVESDVGNNEATATVDISPISSVLQNFHVYPNPVDSPVDAYLAGNILTSQTNFLARYTLEVFDLTGLRVLSGEDQIESTELKIPLSSLIGDASRLVPGIYVGVIKLNVRDEVEYLSATTKFAVVSGRR